MGAETREVGAIGIDRDDVDSGPTRFEVTYGNLIASNDEWVVDLVYCVQSRLFNLKKNSCRNF